MRRCSQCKRHFGQIRPLPNLIHYELINCDRHILIYGAVYKEMCSLYCVTIVRVREQARVTVQNRAAAARTGLSDLLVVHTNISDMNS